MRISNGVYLLRYYVKKVMPSQSTRKLKIIYIVTQGEMGGAQRYAFDLATSLEPEKYDVCVFMGAEKQDLKSALEQKGIRAAIIKNLVRNIDPLRDLAAIFEIKKIIGREKPDIIHLNSGKAGFLGSIAAGLAGNKNVIFTAHGFSFLEPISWPLKLIYLWAEKMARPFRKKIICVSEYDRQAAIKYNLANQEQVVTIHNGIKLTPELPLRSSSLIKEGEGGVLIGTVANLYPTKGLTYLVRAAKKITTNFPIAKFVVIGEGSERKNLESEIANLGLTDNFILMGEKENAMQYLSNFDVFVLPSIKEGFPYTLLEAMAAGLPIVAAKAGGIPEAIEDGKEGLLVPPCDAEALAGATKKLLEDSDLAKTLGRNAREKVKQFSLEKMAQSTRQLYQTVLFPPKSKP